MQLRLTGRRTRTDSFVPDASHTSHEHNATPSLPTKQTQETAQRSFAHTRHTRSNLKRSGLGPKLCRVTRRANDTD